MREGRRRPGVAERKEKGRKRQKKNGRNLVSTGVEIKEKKNKKKKKKESGVFRLILFWYNFLIFAKVAICD